MNYRGLVEEKEAEERWRTRVARRQRRYQSNGVSYIVAPKQALCVPRPLALLLRSAVVEPERRDNRPSKRLLCSPVDIMSTFIRQLHPQVGPCRCEDSSECIRDIRDYRLRLVPSRTHSVSRAQHGCQS